jgi:hypothetical protein
VKIKLGYLLLPIGLGLVASLAGIIVVLRAGPVTLLPWVVGCANYTGLGASYFFTSWKSHKSKDLWRQVELADLLNIVVNPLSNGFCAWLAAHLFSNLEQIQIALTWMGAPIAGLCTVLLYLRQSDVEKVSAKWQYAISWLSPIIALGVLALFCQTYVPVIHRWVQMAPAGPAGVLRDALSPVSANYALATGLPALVCVLYGASQRRYVFFGAPKEPYYKGRQILLAIGFLVGGLMAADYLVAMIAYTIGNLAMGMFITGSPIIREGIGSLVANALSTLGGLVLALFLLGLLPQRRQHEQRRQRGKSGKSGKSRKSGKRWKDRKRGRRRKRR